MPEEERKRIERNLIALHHPSRGIRLDAAIQLAEIRHPDAIPALARLLLRESYAHEAAKALRKTACNLTANEVRTKEEKALQLVGQYFRENEGPNVIHKAYVAALEGKITPKNARLYVKQLRALKGSLK